MKKSPKYSFVCGDDWSGFYINDVLKLEGHKITPEDILEILEIDFERFHVNQEWLEDLGNLPKNIKDVVKENGKKYGK